jgi:hypothetical protein
MPENVLKEKIPAFEENKSVLPRGSRYESKFDKFKQQSYVNPNGMESGKQTADVPQKSRHMMKFCLGEKDNKLLKREIKASDHLDMYTSTVNHSNARVNMEMQSKRAAGHPPLGSSTYGSTAFPGNSNLLMQKHGRDNLIRAPFLWQ